MKKFYQRILSLFLIVLLLTGILSACAQKGEASGSSQSSSTSPASSQSVNSKESSSSPAASLPESSATPSSPAESMPDLEGRLFPLAEALTNHLVNLVFTPEHIENGQPLQDGDLFRFMLSLLVQSENSLSDFYPDCVSVSEDGSAVFPLEPVQRMVSEVFGQNDWFFSDPSYDEQQNAYSMTVGFGLGSAYSYEDLTLTWHEEENIVAADFILIDTPNFPGEQSYGAYQILYRAVTEDGRTFLRYQGVQKFYGGRDIF